MAVKDQFVTLKENWLLVVLGLVVILVLSGGNNFVAQNLAGGFEKNFAVDYDMAAERGVATSSYYPGYVDDGFAPEVEERKITKTASLSTEIERGEFKDAEMRLKNIVTSSGAYLLNENSNRYGEGWQGYYSGYYSLKVDNEKYDSVLSQLREIGEVQSFNENMADITGSYEDVSIELEVERERLARYLEMYEEATTVEEKINLNDRIFNQERTIKYLEDRLSNLDNRVDYSTISFSMTEERSDWTNMAIVGISDLAKSFVSNLNSLLKFIFGVLPWVVAAWIVWFFWKRFRK